MNISKVYVVTTIFVGILLAGCATESRIDPLHPIELGGLTFLAPPGEDWEYDRDDSSDIEFVVFKKAGSTSSAAFGVMVWQVRVDDPVNSEEDLWANLLEPYRDVWEAQERNELKKTECNPDQTQSPMGLLCQVEGEADIEGSFWATGIVWDSKTIEAEGHVYAFVFPDDNRQIGVIEYFQQLLPGVDRVDTKQLIVEFARNVILLK
jgi:hypothetical protein